MKELTILTLGLFLASIIDYVNTACAQINLEKCSCDHPTSRKYFIYCQDRGLTAMPPRINRSLSDGEASGDFSMNAITSIPGNYFENMKYFEILDFSSNKISSIGADSLKQLDNSLASLYMRNNKIKSIAPNTFAGMTRLNTLDLSGNSISSPCGIKTKDVTDYSLAANGITRLNDNCFPDSVKVVKLNLSRNRISHIGRKAFDGLTAMEELDLGYNSLSDFSDGILSLIDLSSVHTLSLRGNDFQYLESICGHRLPNLKSLDLGHNNLVDLQKYCFNIYFTGGDNTDITLNFEHNFIPSLAGSTFLGLDKRLVRLLLNNNRITEIDVSTFTKLTRLTYLNLNHNSITSLEFLRDWQDNDLLELSLANNQIHTLLPGVFLNLDKLTKLNLDSNYLLYIESNAFSGMSSLSDLSIEYNLMTNLADGAFAGLSRLQKLKVTGNGLVTLKNCTFANLDNLVQFHFDDNLLHCDCDLMWLLPFMNRVNNDGISSGVEEPVLEDKCHYPLTSTGLIMANQVSGNCRDSHVTTNACVGLEVQFGEPIEEEMNITWSYDPQSPGKVEQITLTQLDIESNTLMAEEDVTEKAMPITLQDVKDDKIYKV